MKRAILFLLLVALAPPVRADDGTSKSMSGTPKATRTPAKPSAPPPKLTPAQQRIRDVDLAKVKFMSAVGACPKPEDCDPASPRKNPDLIEMLQKGETAFMEACIQCAPDKACEQERDRIRAGRGRMGYNVCAELAAKSKGKDGKPEAEKKPAGGGATAPKPASQTQK